jgi:hypothetical protein
MEKNIDGIIKFFRYSCLLFILILGFITIIGSGPDGPWNPDTVYDDMYTSIAIDDLNGDGALDIAVTRSDLDSTALPSSIVVIFQDPLKPGSFQSPRSYSIGNEAWSIAIGDLNDDGLPDLAAANQRSNSVSILFQDPAEPGNFLAATNLKTGIYPRRVTIGDLNGDGLKDLVIADKNTSILLQDPNTPGTFLSATTLGFQSSCVAIGDLNGDSLPDLAVTGVKEGTIAILFQDSTNIGEFLPATYVNTGYRTRFVSIGYIDGDLLPDLAVVNAVSGAANDSVSVLLQDPGTPGSFLDAGNYITGRASDEIAIEDMNGDNLNDLVVVNSTGHVGDGYPVGTISVLLQNLSGDGTFQDPKDYNMIFQPLALAIGDLNGDNLPDIAVADDGALVLFQKPSSPGNFYPPKHVGG